MSLANTHIPIRNPAGAITHYIDDGQVVHSVESIRESMMANDDSHGAISWLDDIEDEDLVAIWGMSDGEKPASAASIPDSHGGRERAEGDAGRDGEPEDGGATEGEEGTQEPRTESEGEDGKARSEEQRRIRASRLRMRLMQCLDDISYYGYFASWAFFGLFIVGKFVSALPLISFIGIVGSLISVSSSLVASEILGRFDGQCKMLRVAVMSFGTCALASLGLYGLLTGNSELSSAGVIGLLAWSFVPAVMDMAKHHGIDFEYREYEYDDDGNVVNANDFDDATASYGHYRSPSSSGNAFAAVNEVFGIPQPVDPPPIEVSRDDMYDDEWGRVIEGVEVTQDEDGNMVIRSVDTSKEHEDARIGGAEASENDDTLH